MDEEVWLRIVLRSKHLFFGPESKLSSNQDAATVASWYEAMLGMEVKYVGDQWIANYEVRTFMNADKLKKISNCFLSATVYIN